MSTTTTKLSDDFLCIPKLEVTSQNWVIYKDQFIWAVDAQGFAEHLDANAVLLVDTLLAKRPTMEVLFVMMAQQQVLDTEWKKEMKLWQQGEVIVKQQIQVFFNEYNQLKLLCVICHWLSVAFRVNDIPLVVR